MREAAAKGDENYLVAGVSADHRRETECIDPQRSTFVTFNGADVPFQIPGMSDVMPYESKRFRDLTATELDDYEKAFSQKLRRAVYRFGPDIIHSHHLWIVSSLVRRLFPAIPLVTSCHGSDLRQFQNCPHLRERVLSGCRAIDIVTALSRAQKDDIMRLYGLPPQKIVIAGAGYNDRLFYASPKPPPEPVQLVYAGKLSNAKGVPWLLRALKGIDEPTWQLHLLGSGSGEEKENCLRLVQTMGDKVCAHGAVPQQSLAEIMRQSHILVLPSFFEGLPLVILEGLASGCRVVATDLPGARALLGDADAEFVTLVKTPRLRNLDEPHREDENAFEQNLARALKQQMNAAVRYPQIDLASIQDKIDAFTWAGVFTKVRDAYLKCPGLESA